MIKLLITCFIIVSCQTNPSKNTSQARFVASGEVVRTFISKFAQSAQMTDEAVEQGIIQYFKTKTEGQTHPNYVSVGISKEEAESIKSLSDARPFMHKAKKWAMENMDKIFPKANKSELAKIYDEIIVKNRGGENAYLDSSAATIAKRKRRRQISPVKSISDRQEKLLDSINKLDDKSYGKNLRQILATFAKRANSDPTLLANGQFIIESAAQITKKTGINAIGKGCKSFITRAPAEAIANKANVDLARLEIVEEMLANGKKITQNDLDEATELAFRRALGYSDEEAARAVKTLKGKNCKLY